MISLLTLGCGFDRVRLLAAPDHSHPWISAGADDVVIGSCLHLPRQLRHAL